MATEVTIGGLTTSNLSSFSVQEDATPKDISSSAGGVGTISMSMSDFDEAPFLLGRLALTDGTRGKTSGIVRDLGGSNGVLNIAADSILGLFNSEKSAPPFEGTFGNAVQMYCNLVGIDNQITVDEPLRSRSVIYPGWRGNVWTYIKQMLAAERAEMSLVFDTVHVRALRTNIADTDRLTQSGWSISNSAAARSVEIYYRTLRSGSLLEAYPIPGEDPNILSVSAGETQVISLQLSASLSSVNQPVAQYVVNNTQYEGTDGVYGVTGSDGLPIQPAQWEAYGGQLSVALTDDPTIVEITLRGADLPDYSPFQVAMSAGSGTAYNALHITGEGVAWTKTLITIPTGVSEDVTSTDVGVTVDSPYVTSLSKAYEVAVDVAAAHSGLEYTVTGNAFALNRPGDETLIGYTIADFNTAWSGLTIDAFNTAWVSQTIAAFNEYSDTQVTSLWENQLFGNAPGARVLGKYANFRIVSTSTNETGASFSAALDTTVGDFNPVWSVRTVADFNTVWNGYTVQEFSLTSLRGN